MNGCIKLQPHITIFEDDDIHHVLLVYNVKEEKIFLKIPLTKIPAFSIVELKTILYRFTSLEVVTKSKYASLVLSLYSKYPDIFVYSDEPSLLKKDAMRYEMEQTMDVSKLYATYPFSMDNMLNKQLVLWGGSKANVYVYESARGMGVPVTFVLSMDEVIEPNDMLHAEEQVGTRKIELIQKMIADDEHAKLYVLEEELYKEEVSKIHSLHVLCCNCFSAPQIDHINEIIQQDHQHLLYYGMYESELVIGPLVIPNQTQHYADFEKHDVSHKIPFPTIFHHLSAGIIQRISYYVWMDALKYVAEDAQLPLNSIFVIHQRSLLGTSKKWNEMRMVHESKSGAITEALWQ